MDQPEDLFRHLPGVFRVANAVEHQCKLVAAKACYQITSTQTFLQPVSDFGEQLVPRVMPHGVVDILEMVDVQE